MARPRPEKKPARIAGGQLPLPTPGQPASSSTARVLPMQLQVGDRLIDETGETGLVEWTAIDASAAEGGGR